MKAVAIWFSDSAIFIFFGFFRILKRSFVCVVGRVATGGGGTRRVAGGEATAFFTRGVEQTEIDSRPVLTRVLLLDAFVLLPVPWVLAKKNIFPWIHSILTIPKI